MNQPFPVRAIAGCLALAAFAIAIISGLAAGRSTDSIISSALVALIVGQVVGYIAGMVIARTLLENIQSYKSSRGAPEELSPVPGNTAGAPGTSES